MRPCGGARRVWWGEEGEECTPLGWAQGSAPISLRLELCPVGSEEQVPPLALLPLEVGQEDKRPRRHRGGGCGCGVWSKGLELDRLRHDAQLRPRYPCRDEALHVPPGRHPDLTRVGAWAQLHAPLGWRTRLARGRWAGTAHVSPRGQHGGQHSGLDGVGWEGYRKHGAWAARRHGVWAAWRVGQRCTPGRPAAAWCGQHLVCGAKAVGLFGRKVALGHRPRDHPERAIRCGPPAYAARLAVLDDDGGARLRWGSRTLVCPRLADRVGLLYGELASQEVFAALAAEEAEAATRRQREHEAQGDLHEEAREAAADRHPPLDLDGKRPQDDVRR